MAVELSKVNLMVPAQVVKREVVHLSPEEARKVAVQAILNTCDLHAAAYVEGGKLKYEHEDRRGSHSSFETVEVREATEMDIAALAVIAVLRKAGV